MQHPTNLDLDKSGNFTNQYNRWQQHSTYLTYGKTSVDCVLPRISAKSRTGPLTADMDGTRWILAHFDDGSRLIVQDMFMSGKDGRAARHKEAFEKLGTAMACYAIVCVTNC